MDYEDTEDPTDSCQHHIDTDDEKSADEGLPTDTGAALDADNMNFDTLTLVGNGATYPNYAGCPVQADRNSCAPRMLCFQRTRLTE